MSRHLNIVCSNVPHPADCGNSIDCFEKMLALKKCGVEIHLHVLSEAEPGCGELNCCCKNVQTYNGQSASLRVENLTSRLHENDFPILLDGLYDPAVIDSLSNSNKKVLMRMHSEFFSAEENSWKNFAGKLFPWANNDRKKAPMPSNFLYVCYSETDVICVREKYQLASVEVLPPFIAWQEVKCGDGTGNFCLYHGNLSDPENERMAIWLLEKVFSEVRVPFIIAGKNPSRRLNKLAQLYANACIVANPSRSEIDDLVQKAHINIVPSFSTGGKYKLLHSLFEGRHCITNDASVRDTNLADVCHVANDSRSKISTIKALINKPFSERETELRKEVLLPRYDNLKNAVHLLEWLY